VSRTTVAEIETGARDPGLNTLRVILRAAGLDLDVHLIAQDDHDDILQKTLDDLPAPDRARLERGFQHFVRGLADGLASSRPLIGGDD
jgi:transcriptional regulator with XRE-family HTH domain